jgi:hypothetical protein
VYSDLGRFKSLAKYHKMNQKKDLVFGVGVSRVLSRTTNLATFLLNPIMDELEDSDELKKSLAKVQLSERTSVGKLDYYSTIVSCVLEKSQDRGQSISYVCRESNPDIIREVFFSKDKALNYFKDLADL